MLRQALRVDALARVTCATDPARHAIVACPRDSNTVLLHEERVRRASIMAGRHDASPTSQCDALRSPPHPVGSTALMAARHDRCILHPSAVILQCTGVGCALAPGSKLRRQSLARPAEVRETRTITHQYGAAEVADNALRTSVAEHPIPPKPGTTRIGRPHAGRAGPPLRHAARHLPPRRSRPREMPAPPHQPRPVMIRSAWPSTALAGCAAHCARWQHVAPGASTSLLSCSIMCGIRL